MKLEELTDAVDELLALIKVNNQVDQLNIAEVGIGVVSTLVKKNIDYGSSVFDSPILDPTIPAGASILVRMSDKIKRISQLRQVSNEKGTPHIAESLEDSIRDLAGYCILYLCLSHQK